MTKDELDFGFSLDELNQFLIDNNLKLVPFTALVAAKAKIGGYNIAYKLLGDQQMTPITGSTEIKSDSRTELESLLLSIGRPASGVFFELGKFDLQVQVECTATSLSNLRGVELVSKAELVISVCTPNLLDLVGINVTAPKIAALELSKTNFATNNILPNTKIKGRADIGKEITSLQKTIRTYLSKVLTKQMSVFEIIDKPFLDSYSHIIKQIHTGVRHNAPFIPTIIKTFQIFNIATNDIVVGAILQAFETPGASFSNKNGLIPKKLVPIGQCTIQAQAFGFENYSQSMVIDPTIVNYINIFLTPVIIP